MAEAGARVRELAALENGVVEVLAVLMLTPPKDACFLQRTHSHLRVEVVFVKHLQQKVAISPRKGLCGIQIVQEGFLANISRNEHSLCKSDHPVDKTRSDRFLTAILHISRHCLVEVRNDRVIPLPHSALMVWETETGVRIRYNAQQPNHVRTALLFALPHPMRLRHPTYSPSPSVTRPLFGVCMYSVLPPLAWFSMWAGGTRKASGLA